MGVHVLERRQVLNAAMEEVFGFFEDPLNLEELTPAWLGFRILDATDPSVRQGTQIHYRLKWGPFGMDWRSRITEYEPGRLFADEMLEGPYRSWYHRHVFTEVEGGVEMLDRVEYEMPFGPLGRVAHALVVRRQLTAIFDFRALAVSRRFGAITSLEADSARGHGGHAARVPETEATPS